MSDETDRAAARAQLILWLQPAVEPTLTTDGDGNELDTLLDNHKLASTWTAETEYSVGDEVLPTVRTGSRYRCVKGGTSGVAEPGYWPTRQAATVYDGDAVWQQFGPDFTNIYDARAAARAGWLLKASKVVPDAKMKFSKLEFDTKTYDHCLAMAEKFLPLTFG
jgi:hypothetical protein